MNQNSFTEEDKKKVIEFLNFVSKNAKFEINTQEVVEYFKLLSFMQGTLLPKIDSNILQITRVVEAPLEEPKKKSK